MSDFAWQTTFTIPPESRVVFDALFADTPEYSVTLDIPARRRTFRDWLRRAPRHSARRILLPNVELAADQTNERSTR